MNETTKNNASDSGFHFLQDYLTCQERFKWKYFYKLVPLWESPSMMFGDAFHAGMAAWYSAHQVGIIAVKAKLVLAKDAFIDRMSTLEPKYKFRGTYNEDVERGKNCLDNYALEYPYETWKVVLVESTLSHTFEETGDRFTGRLDLGVVTHEQRRYVVDHKTTGWALANLIKSLGSSDQATGYIWLWNDNHPPEEAVHGVLFNIIRMYKDNPPEFKHYLVMKSDMDIERFERDAAYTLAEIAHKVADPTNARFVRNTGACFKYNRPCDYLDLCKGSNYQSLIGTTYKKEDI